MITQLVDCREQRETASVISVLFVCTGNICRSPTAEGVFRNMVETAGLGGKIDVDSAGTIAYHAGEAPDARAQEAALERGIDLSHQQARQLTDSDFVCFDYLVALDTSHLIRLKELCPNGENHRIRSLMEFAPHFRVDDVPDPYYGATGGFDRVFDLVEAGAAGLLDEIRRTKLAKP